MARNQHAGICYQCGRRVAPLTGHFERHQGRWRVKHANVSGYGRVTCEMAKKEPEPKARGYDVPIRGNCGGFDG